MGGFQIFLFGRVRVLREGQPSEINLTPALQLLFAYLLLERRRFHPREVLAGLFWSDASPKSARSCLNTAVWRLRGLLDLADGPQPPLLLTTPSGDIGLNPDAHFWLDVASFEDQLAPVLKKPFDQLTPQDVETLKAGLELYTGDLLDGVYEDWALSARETQRLLFLKGLTCLMQYCHQAQEFEHALEAGQKILALDPLREDVHREIMHLYLESGQRALAARQYEICREMLENELGIAPMEETRLLYERITILESRPRRPSRTPLDLHQAIQHLKEARLNLELAMREYKMAAAAVEKLAQNDNHG